MGTAEQIVSNLREQGFLVRIRADGMIGISPSDRLTPELREKVTENKEDIIDTLAREQEEMSEETRKVARTFEGSYVPRGVDRAVALIGARIMASGCPLEITASDGKHFPIRNLDDYRAYAAHTEMIWKGKEMITIKFGKK